MRHLPHGKKFKTFTRSFTAVVHSIGWRTGLLLDAAMDNKLLMVAGATIHQLIVAYTFIFDDVPTKFEERMKKRR